MNGGAVPPRAVVATIALSVIGCALFLVLPQFVEAAITDLHYSEREVGFLGSLLMVGSSLTLMLALTRTRTRTTTPPRRIQPPSTP